MQLCTTVKQYMYVLYFLFETNVKVIWKQIWSHVCCLVCNVQFIIGYAHTLLLSLQIGKQIHIMWEFKVAVGRNKLFQVAEYINHVNIILDVMLNLPSCCSSQSKYKRVFLLLIGRIIRIQLNFNPRFTSLVVPLDPAIHAWIDFKGMVTS